MKLFTLPPLLRWTLLPMAVFAALGVVLSVGAAGVVALMYAQLPPTIQLNDWKPKLPMRIRTADGLLVAEFGQEARIFERYDDTPKILVDAVLSAEDDRFFNHHGIDFKGIARAAVANLSNGGKGQGASTITMQVARNLYLSREKTLERKIYEALTAVKIERELRKERILEIYMNQIYLGRRAYGFSAAAAAYFGKKSRDLTIAEAAMLAGLPKAPSAYNPYANPARARQRQLYVLGRMLETGRIDRIRFEQAKTEPLKLRDARESSGLTEAAPGVLNGATDGDFAHAAEAARLVAMQTYGEQALSSGLTVVLTINSDEQRAAANGLRAALFEHAKRQGGRPLVEGHVSLDGADPQLRIEAELEKHPVAGGTEPAVVMETTKGGLLIGQRGDRTENIKITAEDTRRQGFSEIRTGSVIRIQRLGREAKLAQLPRAEGALVAMDPATGRITSLVGGFDFRLNQFDHALSAERQPGSSFKPFIYSAALEKGFSPFTKELDEPLVVAAAETGSASWEPKNYDHRYEGVMTLRQALAKSKNMVAARIIGKIGTEYARSHAIRFGFEPGQIQPVPSIALGAVSATPVQMAAGYSVFANGGFSVRPHIIAEILDANGQVVAKFDHEKHKIRAISERNAWLMTNMMREVTTRGTAAKVASMLKRGDLAGKTGTTNEQIDAWFCGYGQQRVAVVWIGRDTPESLGRGETGGTTALPAWIAYMEKTLPALDRAANGKSVPMPEGIVTVKSGTMQEFAFVEHAHAVNENPTVAEAEPDEPSGSDDESAEEPAL